MSEIGEGPGPAEASVEHKSNPLSKDLQASVVVFLVALPLCMAIAEASGVPPLRGIVTGIIGGIIVGVLAGSPLQVSGPAAGLFVLVLQFIESIRSPFLKAQLATYFPASASAEPGRQSFIEATKNQPQDLSVLTRALDKPIESLPRGPELEQVLGQIWDHSYGLGTELALKYLAAAVLVAGLTQILAAALRLGQWFRAISPAVVNGMLAGIGVIIFAKQFHVMVDDPSPGSPLMKLLTIPLAINKGLFSGAGPHRYAALIGVTTLGVLVLWNRFRPKKLKAVPGALVAVVAASLVAALLGLRHSQETPIAFIEVPDEMSSALTVLGFSAYPLAEFFQIIQDERVLKTGLTICLVASAESLLCATAVDLLHTGPRTRHDKELFAQGVGNALCGVLGALPMTGVIVRSSANIEAGAQSRWSAVFHGVWLLALVALAPAILEAIPTSALAAVLVYTGFRLFWRPDVVRELGRYGRFRVIIFFTTIAAIVATDLLRGIAVGFLMSFAQIVALVSHLEVVIDDQEDGSKAVRLVGSATFLRLPTLAMALEALPLTGRYELVLRELDQIDHACLELIASWEKQVETAGGSVSLEWDILTQRFRRPGHERRAESGALPLKPNVSGH